MAKMEKTRQDWIEDIIAEYRKTGHVSLSEKKEVLIELAGLPINTKISTIDEAVEICLNQLLNIDEVK